MERRDIVVTWPKTKPLDDYIRDLDEALFNGQYINYKVARLPHWPDEIEDHGTYSWSGGVIKPKCFMVHSGFVRGWCRVLGTGWREAGEVEGWPEGWYITRSALWMPADRIVPMKGFQGWRWYDGS